MKMNGQNLSQVNNNDTPLTYWINNLSDENKRLEQKISKDTTSKIAQPGTIITIADWNEAIRKFAGSFLFKKTETSYYRMMATYLGEAIGIDIRISNHPAENDDNWLLTEGNGIANCRLSIYFRGDTSATTRDCIDGVPLYEQGFHYEHLKNAKVLADIRNRIIGFMKTGAYIGINQPLIESDNTVAEKLRKNELERNERKRTRYFAGADANKESGQPKQVTESKKTITESQLKQFIKECIRETIAEKEEQYGPNGYRIVKGGMDYTINGEKRHSAISVVDKSGNQSYHIGTDDHCYIFYATWKGKTERYENPYIFDELLDAIKTLPKPE